MDKIRQWTDEDLLRLPMGMGERYELIEGELITMSPAGGEHGQIADIISGEIYLYLKKHKLGKGVTAETGFYTRGNKKTVRAPDYAFIRREKLGGKPLPKGFLTIVPDLVVEVVSPNDEADEIEAKVQEWRDFGVTLVWIVYPKTRHVHVYTQGDISPTVLTLEAALSGETVLPDFTLPLKTIFEQE